MGNSPMKTEVVLDLKRITAEVAARHGMLVRQDDPEPVHGGKKF